MPEAVDLRTLHQLETRLLQAFDADESFAPTDVIARIGFNRGQANQALSWLQGKGLVAEVTRDIRVVFELSDSGRTLLETGLPEQRIADRLRIGPATLDQLADELGLDKAQAGSAYGSLARDGFAGMNADRQVELKNADASLPEEVQLLHGLLHRAAQKPLGESDLSEAELAVARRNAKKRGTADSPFRLSEEQLLQYRVTGTGRQAAAELRDAGVTGTEVSRLTPEMLQTGSWRDAAFRPYSLNVPPARAVPGRTNAYVEFISWVKDRLVAQGFEEFDGPLVETEFWNSDALFMPQFHAARDIHDVYYVATPTHASHIQQPYLDQVAAAHENGAGTGSRGWQYSFDRDFTRRLILRSQGTVLSARQLTTARVPGRYFGIVRCFRYDQVDATHLSDFYQTEGIVLSPNVNLRTLLGLLKMFAVEVAGATDVRYVPGYFPFTEPSVEVHIKHPRLGWFELGGSGIFRPEVTRPLGVNVPVLAWGLGIDRMALMQLGLNDLRELFTPDLEQARLRRRPLQGATHAQD